MNVRPLMHAGVLLATAAGCASFSSVQTADTLGRGNLQVGVEPGLWGGASSSGKTAAVPHVDVAVRFGVSDRVDLGVRAGSSSVELQSKFLLTEPSNPRWAASLAPTAGGVFAFGAAASGSGPSPAGILNLALPMLVGVKLPFGHQVVLGPRVQALLVFSGGALTTILGVGTSAGFAWRLSDNFTLLPELAFVYPVVGSDSAGAVFRSMVGGGTFVQLKLGVLYQLTRRPDPREAPVPADLSPPPLPPEAPPPPAL